MDLISNPQLNLATGVLTYVNAAGLTCTLINAVQYKLEQIFALADPPPGGEANRFFKLYDGDAINGERRARHIYYWGNGAGYYLVNPNDEEPFVALKDEMA